MDNLKLKSRAEFHINFCHNKRNQIGRIYMGEYEMFLNKSCLGPPNSPKWKLKKQFKSRIRSNKLEYGTFLRQNYPEKFREEYLEFNKNISKWNNRNFSRRI